MADEERIEQGASEAESQQEEKKFTQSEVDALISKRLARALKNVPDKNELTAYRAWKKNHADDEREQADDRLAAAKEAVEQMKRDNYILKKGVSGEDAEYIAFKAGKMVDKTTTFEQAVDQLTEGYKKVSFDWSGKVRQSTDTRDQTASLMNQLIRDTLRN